MRIQRLWIVALLATLSWGVVAHTPDLSRSQRNTKKVQYRGVCANSEAQIDMEINNVRARLLNGGDCWWDFDNGRYIVPKVDVSSGQTEVSSIFAGSVWLGGVDPAGNLKLACQDYGHSGGTNDFWPGPLNEVGTTDEGTCKNWDRHFRVTGDEIRKHLANLLAGNLSESAIPRGVKGWPARGNELFADVWGFDLPYTNQGLAGFYDANGNNLYEPLKGDYPSIEIRGCAQDRFPDEMVFWIYNDQGGGAPHARTKGSPIQMEVQVQAFAYLTNDELNDMTFQRYKLINRATERIDSMFFAMWADPDLGCFLDDYIGCDSTLDLMYCYNGDATDGQPNCDCPSQDGPVPTYCDQVPIIGIDYFRGPLDTFGEEIGLSSFVYYNNPAYNNPPAYSHDPDLPVEFYRYLTGSWKDGTPFTYGGDGYGGTEPTKYALQDPPNDPNGWSMCSANLPVYDRRTLQASGPFTLLPGAVNELIIGIPWVADIDYPCPDVEQIFRADKLAQGLFDNCFELLDGPDAPKVDWIELNQQLVAVLSNDSISNNFNETYSQVDFLGPDSLKNSMDSLERESVKYKFEGYRIYQLINPNVSTADFDDPDKSRPVFQVDIKNGISKIYNWLELRDPNTGNRLYYPELQVDGQNQGLRRTFPILDDKFATGNDKRLINHKKYYYAVIAYAYNNFGTFDPLTIPAPGQQRPYLPGRKSADGPIKIHTVIPRPIVDQVLQANYGDGVIATRLEGVGNNGNFLDLEPDSRNSLFNGGNPDSVLTYKAGRGPITVTIFNPFEVQDGDYELKLVDANMTDNKLDKNAKWELRKLPDGDVIASANSIAQLNEQLVLEYGFSVTVAQPALTGSYTWSLQEPQIYANPGETNGAIGAEIEYADPNQRWLVGFPDQDGAPFHFVKTRKLERDNEYDPFQALSTLGNGWFVPYPLCEWDVLPDGETTITPGWTSSTASLNRSAIGGNQSPANPDSRYRKLATLPNVDIVLTSDTSKWSRCVIIESASHYYTETANDYPKDATLATQSPAGKTRFMFDVRYSLSVGKTDADGDGKPDPDGAKETNGNPIYGMGWFPGYAIDVESGRRLNIFFGENSCYTDVLDPLYTGRDMLWNPTDQFTRDNPRFYYDLVLGGQHWVYVMNSNYDGCESARKRFTPELNPNPAIAKVSEIKKIAWAGMLQLAPDFKMKSLKDGLIPNDVVFKLRTNKPYDTWSNDDDGNKKTGHPLYQFKIQNKAAIALDRVQVENALDSVKVVPNPYYGYSQYETSQFTNTVKITNLPAKCTVTIYSLDGKFIRQYKREEVYKPYQQIAPDLEWDLRNSKGIPVASGVYLIHFTAPEMGERTIKWFGIARQFDPSGL
ncbi:MAG: hypothetical protein IT260_10245 [Saprospiraceae bacterium]|nr:hypothetical protein [Saprospiraceae bacterium]